jgi:hypothetical protein
MTGSARPLGASVWRKLVGNDLACLSGVEGGRAKITRVRAREDGLSRLQPRLRNFAVETGDTSGNTQL